MKGSPTHWTTLQKLIWLQALQGGGGGGEITTVTGVSPLLLANALAHSIKSLTQYGKCTQEAGATPSTPKGIYCNNGALKCSMNMANVNEQTALIGYYISAQGVVTADTNNWIYQDFVPCKPSTTYTLSMSESVYYVTISEYSTADDSGFLVRKTGSTGGNTSLTITTGATTNFLRFGANLDRTVVTLEEVLGINWMLNIGDTAMDYQPYVEDGIYTEGESEVLTVRGVNLCNPAYYQGSGWYVGANNTVTNANANGTLVFPCKPNTTYSWWHTAGAGGCRAFELPTDTVTQGQEATWAVGNPAYNDAMTVRKYTTSASAKLLCVLFGRDAAGVDRTIAEQLADFMLVEGDITTATPYEPYHAPQTVSDILMLLSVGDDKDALKLISGNADRAITVFRVNPDLNWLLASGTGYKQFYTSDTQGQLKNSVSCMSNIAPYGCTASNRASYQFGCYTGGTGNLCFQMIGEASLNTVDAWKDFLRTNGVYVVAAKAGSTTEQTTPHSLHTSNGTNVVDVDCPVGSVELSVEYMAGAA